MERWRWALDAGHLSTSRARARKTLPRIWTTQPKTTLCCGDVGVCVPDKPRKREYEAPLSPPLVATPPSEVASGHGACLSAHGPHLQICTSLTRLLLKQGHKKYHLTGTRCEAFSLPHESGPHERTSRGAPRATRQHRGASAKQPQADATRPREDSRISVSGQPPRAFS